jgi:predicted RNA methylase
MRRITERQCDLLRALVVEDNHAVFGTDEHIDDWDALKAVMALLGAKWKVGRKGKGGEERKGAFVFPEYVDANEMIWLARERGEVFDAKKAGFFATSPPLADELVAKLMLSPHARAFEPSAGTGNIVAALVRACPTVRVSCVELLADHAAILTAMGHPPIGTDFLALRPTAIEPFDVVAMNPPFGGNGDAKHVLHATRFVRPGGRLAAIVSPGILFRKTEVYSTLRRWVERHGDGGVGGMKEIQAGAFSDAGTNIRTVMIWGVVCNRCFDGGCVAA